MAVKLSARNMLEAKVTGVKHGAVNTEVAMELRGGQEIVAVITKASSEALGLSEGKDVYAVVKATSVMVGTE
jgi:molybdopterin-binding protein